jgi:hypothetical protein
MARRSITAAVSLVAALTLIATPALACGGLINANGSVTLVRTTTLAAYHEGIEHYVTSFAFAGSGGEFGSIVPLPGVPTKVIRGGDWTLQRLILETQPPQPSALAFEAADAAGGSARVLLEAEIDALDVVVLEGGATEVGIWATDHGFLLPPDAPEVLEFYAERSPIFMAVRFDATRAAEQGIGQGDGTPVHLVIPTENPWVPLRILGLGAGEIAPVEADVYLLTDRAPALLPEPVSPLTASFLDGRGTRPGLVLERSEPASPSLLADLRSDRGMRWLPADDVWLSYLRVDARAGDLDFDLAVDASGAGEPSPVDAGIPQSQATPQGRGAAGVLWLVAAAGVVLAVARGTRSRDVRGRPA